MNEELLVYFGVDPSAEKRIRDWLGRWMRANDAARVYTEMQLGLAAVEFTNALREEFQKGTDKYGRSHNKTGAALRSIRIQLEGMMANVFMGGGAVYVEYGWTRPAIRAKPGGVLCFVDQDGVTVFTKSVSGATYAGDDFVGRAMMRVDLRAMLERIAYGTFSEMVGFAVDRRGFQYTGGEQFRPIFNTRVTSDPSSNTPSDEVIRTH